jgi:N6-adenosine-specific RNA methylase IME4
MTWFFDPLDRGSYGSIVIDPPWEFVTYSAKGVTAKGAGGQYSTMTLDDIKAMPVVDLCAKNCLVWCWATSPMLHIQFDAVKAWGLRILTTGVWVKTTPMGKLAFGTGRWLHCASEPFILCARGKPRVYSLTERTVLMAPLGRHSEKPSAAYRMLERMAPDVRRADIFGRRERGGYDSWGHESTKFNWSS